MSEMTILRALLLFLLCLAAPAQATAKEWLRAQTDQIVIYSDGWPLELERWTRNVARFDALLRQRFGVSDDQKGLPLTIYLLKDENEIRRLTGRHHVSGLYAPSSEGTFLVAHREPAYRKNAISGRMSLFHECAHHFMYRHYPAAYPAWYREGFADYVSTVEFDAAGNWTFGAPAQNRLKRVLKSDLPVETLLLGDVDTIEPGKRGTFYAWSWLLVHWLNASPKGSAALQDYLSRYSAGDGPEAAAKALGDPQLLQASLEAYARRDLAFQRSREPVVVDVDISVVALDPVEGRLIELSIARKFGHNLPQLRDALLQLARSAPGHPDILRELALTEQELAERNSKPDFQATHRALAQLLAVAPDDARGQALAAELEIKELRSRKDKSPQAWEAARDRLRLAITQNPDDPLPRVALLRSYLLAGEAPPPEARKAAAEAFALQPEWQGARLAHAYSLALSGRGGEAERVAKVLTSDPHAGSLGQKVTSSLGQLRTLTQSER